MKKILTIFIMLLITAAVWAGEYTVQKLPNGQTVVVYPIKDNPIVTIDTWIKTGSINETDENNGVAHFLEHLFFKGTKSHPTGDMDRILESKGAVVNAATSKDFTHYYITIPSEYFDTAMELHSDMLLHPQIPRKELEKERKVVLEEIAKDGNTPSKKVYDNLNDMLYTKHPYKRKVIGSADIIGTIRREEILDYFNNYYAPSNMITLVVGDVDTEKAIAKIQQSFNQEYKKPIKKTFRKEGQLQTQKRKIDYTDTEYGYMMIGFRGVDINNSETYALDVLAEILGGGKSSRLYRDIKEQKGLAFSISASNGSYRDDGIFYISANFTPSSLDKLEKAIFEEIANIQKYGVTDEELNRAKNMLVQDTYYSRESTSNISSELGYIMTLSNSSIIYDTYVENIKKVTAQEVVNAARKFLGTNKSAVSIVLPKSMEGVSQTKETKTHSATKISEHNGTVKYQIDNGSTLLINQNKNNDIIAISVIAKGGEFLEKIPGEGTLTAATMLKGTKKFSAQELAQILDENGIIIEPGCSEDYFVINIQTTTAQIDKTMENKRIVEIYSGAYASGKSETAINRAYQYIKMGKPITLVDLDTVEPAYCLRPLVPKLEEDGIKVVAQTDRFGLGEAASYVTQEQVMVLKNNQTDIIIDVGYGASGLDILDILQGIEDETDVRNYLVVNTSKFETKDEESIKEY